jgi:hypothetical protein
MSIENATKRPWATDGSRDNHPGDLAIVQAETNGYFSTDGRRLGAIAYMEETFGQGTEDDANAELIVRAVNSYDAMLEALEAIVQGEPTCLSGHLFAESAEDECGNCDWMRGATAAIDAATK